jgi:N-acetylmuramoyl-L-alanine amidase
VTRSYALAHWRHILRYAAVTAAVTAAIGLQAQTGTRNAAPPKSAAAAKATGPATVRAVTRAPLPKGERITIELSAEVRYSGDRVPDPDRVYFDFQNSRVPSPVVASARSLPGGALVPGVRLGQYTPTATRVVLDLAGRPRYSAYTMYNPFRLVIDVETEATATTESPAPVRPATPMLPSTPPVTDVAASISRTAVPAIPEPPAASESAYVVEPPAPAAVPPPPLAMAAATNVPLDTLVSKSTVKPAPPPPPPAAKPTTAAATTASPIPAAALSRTRDYSLARQLGLGVSRIVIDPGHGGHDPGAHGVGIVESELVLDVALRLEKLLKEQQGVDVVVTRRTDDFIPLEERTDIANREGADLFLSIHANASTRPAARGIETYFLNFATNPEAEAVAARENATSGRNMGKLPDLVKTIALNNKVVESRELAHQVQDSMIRRLKIQNKSVKDLGVKQAPFVVLIGAQMPSILAEISFLTNKAEASLLKQSTYRQRIAQSLADGVLRYQSSLKRTPAVAVKAQAK